MCNEEKKFYVMEKDGDLSGPLTEDDARKLQRDYERDYPKYAPHRVVTIVATEVPEPPKVSRVVRSQDGTGYRFCGSRLQWESAGAWRVWLNSFATANDIIRAGAHRDDYAFVRDFAALCEEVLGGAK